MSIVAAYVTAVAANLISVPLALGYLGVDRYGILVTIVAFALLIAVGDLGIGNAILNFVTDAHAIGDRARIAAATSAAALIVGFAMGTLVLLTLAASLFVPWDDVLNVRIGTATGDIAPAVMLAILLSAATVVVNLAQQVRRGYQEGYVNSAFVAAGNVLSLVAVATAVRMNLGLVGVVGAVLGLPLLAGAANAALLVGRDRPWLRPSFSRKLLRGAPELIVPGFGFFLYQVALLVAWSSADPVIASLVAGAQGSAEYSIAARIFLLPTTIVLAVLLPLWPAYRDALARDDAPWVRRSLMTWLWRTLVFVLVSCTVLVVGAEPLVALWIRSQVQPSLGLLVGAAVWTIAAAPTTALHVYLIARGRIRFLIVTTGISAALHVGLSAALGSVFGSAGVIWGTAVATILAMLLPSAVYTRSLLMETSANAATKL